MNEEMSKFLSCPDCGSEYAVCVDCGNTAGQCVCMDSYIDINLLCNTCGLMYTKDLDDFDQFDIMSQEKEESVADTSVMNPDVDWEEMSDQEWDDYFEKEYPSLTPATLPSKVTPYTGKGRETKTKVGWNTTTTYTQRCRHYGPTSRIEIGKDLWITPSSMSNSRKDGEFVPHFGLYADKGWAPAWRNEFIVFPDFGIPTYHIAVTQITAAVVRATQGEEVEIGCIGGHGRTGTILACMKLYASYRDNTPMTAADAVKWVRSHYCNHAIETEQQEWWVNYYSHWEFGEELGEKPSKSSYGYASSGGYGTCTLRDHFAMQDAGAKECLEHGSKCKHWGTDLNAKRTVTPSKEEIESWKKVLEADKVKVKAKSPKDIANNVIATYNAKKKEKV